MIVECAPWGHRSCRLTRVCRFSAGRVDRDNIIRFALSAEETALILDQIPENDVEFSRMGRTVGDPEKVFRVEPTFDGNGKIVFSVDFELDNIGGHSPDLSSSEGPGPLTVAVPPGEFVVLSELMRTTIPDMLSWSNMMDIAVNDRIKECQKSTGGYRKSY